MNINSTGVFNINKTYDIDVNNKKVTCKFEYSLLGNKENPILNFNNDILKKICPALFKKYPTFPYFTISATAKMSDMDKEEYEFDVEFGKKVASSKAQVKAFNMASNVYNMISDSLYDIERISNTFADGCSTCSDIEYTHIEELINNMYY